MSGDRDPRLDALYRAAADDEPSPALDAAVLAAAHRAVGARPQGTGHGARRWSLPLAAAAVLVISVTVLQLMPREELLTAPQAPASPAADQASPPSPKAAAPAVAAGVAPSRQAAVDYVSPKPAPQASDRAPPVQAPVAATSGNFGATKIEAAKTTEREVRQNLAPEQYVQEARVATPAAAPVPPAPTAFPGEGRAARSAAPEKTTVSALATLEEKSLLKAEAARDASPTAGAGLAASDSLAAAAAAAPRLRKAQGAEFKEAAPGPERSRSEWIDQMLRLYEARQFEALGRELRAFRRSYPEAALPPALAAEWQRIEGSGGNKPPQ